MTTYNPQTKAEEMAAMWEEGAANMADFIASAFRGGPLPADWVRWTRNDPVKDWIEASRGYQG